MIETKVAESRGIDEANRCSISTGLAEKLGKEPEDHVRVESELSKAYFIIDELREERSGFWANEEGLEGIKAQAGDMVTVKEIVPIESRDKAFITGDIAETLWDRRDAEVFISCPHGGDIEYNTGEMGQYLFKKLLDQGIESTAWTLHGYYTGQEKDAFKRWHVKKPVKAYKAYPGLRELVERDASFRYGIGFHIQKADDVGVGGMADLDLRERIADSIRGPVPDKYEIMTDYKKMKWTGRGTKMSMNNFAEDYQGIQIEMPKEVAYNKFHSLPEAVAEVFAELL